MFDVIIVGGSYAGMAAALQLARGRRKVAVLDAGVRRNRFAVAAHGLLGHDGVPPAEIVSSAKGQLVAYPNVTWRNASAVAAEKTGESFVVETDNAETLNAKRLILATGVSDELPEVPGLKERWGRSVFHCPYCHGYELDEGHLGVLATGDVSMHQALLIPDWGTTTFFTNGILEPDHDQLLQLQARNVTLEREPVTRISGSGASVHLRDGRVIDLAGLFIASKIHAANSLTGHLGCEFSDTPLGAVVQTSELKETTVPGVFACGDMTRAAGNISFAITDGVLAGSAVHRSLIFDQLG